MIRTFRTARKTLTLQVVGPKVVIRQAVGKANPKRQERRFRNRYALRKYLTHKVAAAVKSGYEAV
jgi:hypothetical protein